ncbi:hypothetical protein ACSMDF_07105 [Yersinia enterocolitica]
MINDLLIAAISHVRMRHKLNDLNCYFYNRKHETQIRDELVIILNEISQLTAISEYPKFGFGAVDLSLYDHSMMTCGHHGNNVATIELKHHYPKDLLIGQVQKEIISDISRKVVSPTTHFIHIIQQRTMIRPPIFGSVKYLERNATDVNFYVDALEQKHSFPKSFKKKSVCIETHGDLMSAYTFNVYDLRKY